MKTLVLCCLATLLLLATAPTRAHAAFVFTLSQVGTDVVVTGSGTLNTTALTSALPSTLSSEVIPFQATVYSGPASTGVRQLSGLTFTGSLGSGGVTSATSGSGDFVGLSGFFSPRLYVPTGYVSGSSLVDTSTYANTTISALGLMPGTYTATWGTGAMADSLTVDVVPEPSTWALLLFTGSLGAASVVRLRRRVV